MSSGVVGFNAAMLSRLVREKVRPARSDVGASAKKFALRAHNGPKLAFLGVLGEFFRGRVAGGAVLGEFFRANRYCACLGCSVVHFRLAAVGVLHYMKPFCGVSSACRGPNDAIPPWGDSGQIRKPGCMLCAINFACNSPAALSRFELASLELQRFWLLLKFHVIELRANFGDGDPET